MSMRVLVTDGDERAALAVVRSLGRAGHHVLVGSTSGRSIAGASRFAQGEQVLPPPVSAPAAYADAVVHALAQHAAEAVFPITEAALLAVLGARDRLGDAVVPFPSLAAFRAVCDKPGVLEAARALGIAVPTQEVALDAAALRALAEGAVPFPVVVKPARSVAGAGTALRKLSVRHAADPAELARVADELPTEAYPVLVQQRVVGPGTGIFLLLWQGAVRARFAHRRLREKPPSGGVSVYSESVPADPELVARSRRLLEHFGLDGVAMVEYKRDANTGVPYLMEINGRFWGSLQLAIDAGVDFPVLLLEAARGAAAAPAPAYRTGVRLRWLWGDVDQLIMRLRRSPRALHLPAGEPGRLRALLDFLAGWRPGQRWETGRLDDLGPFLCETRQWLAGGPPAPAGAA